MRLHHVAKRISKGNLGLMLEFCTQELGFELVYRIPTDIWLRQPGANIDIQLCETDAPVAEGDKHNSHIAFVSDTPKQDMEKIAAWFEARGKQARIGSWSDREFWLDVPDVFVDFMLECMSTELAEYKV